MQYNVKKQDGCGNRCIRRTLHTKQVLNGAKMNKAEAEREEGNGADKWEGTERRNDGRRDKRSDGVRSRGKTKMSGTEAEGKRSRLGAVRKRSCATTEWRREAPSRGLFAPS